MRTKHLSFQIEETIVGAFLTQGWLGGILATFIYTAAMCLWEPSSFLGALVFSAWLIIPASTAGIIKSIIMWTPYRLAKIQVRAVTRVAITSCATGLFALSIALLFGYRRRNNLVAWVLTCVLAGLPTAILVGSSIKPWELFTFGRIAGERRRSIFGTLGTLPLRFLSLIALAGWFLYFACKVARYQEPLQFTLVFVVVTSYLLFTAYVTFRSPQKIMLLITGLVANVPVMLIGFSPYVTYFKEYALGEASLFVTAICTSFVIAWAVFLVARFGVRTSEVAMPLTIVSNTALTNIEPPNIEPCHHHCLGSRFVEWQRRVS